MTSDSVGSKNGQYGNRIHTGGVIGNGIIIGNGIHIEGDVIVNAYNQAKNYGLSLLTPKYFVEHLPSLHNFEDWRRGFSFNLKSIMDAKQFRRSKLLNDINQKLELQHNLLLVGEAGYSKSTIMMEMICDYFKKGYLILYNYGDTDINNVIQLQDFLENLLKEGNKILIAVDNVHNSRIASIFYIVDEFSDYYLSENIRFLLTARLPEFDWFVDKLNILHVPYAESIYKFQRYRYDLPPFDRNEIRGFYRKVEGLTNISPAISSEELEVISERIYNETGGYPILVRFLVLGTGLSEHVKYIYDIHLRDAPGKLKTMLVCGLLDIGAVTITNQFLKDMKILVYAEDLKSISLQESNGRWKTLHIAWDAELISFLYKESKGSEGYRRAKNLGDTLEDISNINDEKIASAAVRSLYYVAAFKGIPFELVEKITVKTISRLDEDTRHTLYLAIAEIYLFFCKYDIAIAKCDKALEINPRNILGIITKGMTLTVIGKYQEGLAWFNKALEIDSQNVNALLNKGYVFDRLGAYEEALHCYDQALAINPNEPATYERLLGNKGYAHYQLCHYEEALHCYDQALAINSRDAIVLSDKALLFAKLGKKEEAIQYSNKAIENVPLSNMMVLYNKSCIMSIFNKPEESLSLLRDVTRLDPTYKHKARMDPDFNNVKFDPRFQETIADH